MFGSENSTADKLAVSRSPRICEAFILNSSVLDWDRFSGRLKPRPLMDARLLGISLIVLLSSQTQFLQTISLRSSLRWHNRAAQVSCHQHGAVQHQTRTSSPICRFRSVASALLSGVLSNC